MGESNGAPGTTYVVQVRDTIDLEPDEPRLVWEDVAVVTVPPRTKRDTVIRKALASAAIPAGGGVLVLRVIPAEHAEDIPVSWEQPPPQLVIGGESS